MFGQVAAPAFLCVSNDTLFWEAPTNSCGPFNAYLIFASQDESGTYSQLAAITDPNQNFFIHENAGMGVWYYYLESDYDCPGQPVLQSDTLDNLIPEQARLESVSVSGTEVEVSWQPSPSPDRSGSSSRGRRPRAARGRRRPWSSRPRPLPPPATDNLESPRAGISAAS